MIAAHILIDVPRGPLAWLLNHTSQSGTSPRQARELWRKHELQADCLAGVWAHSALRRADADAAIRLATIPLNPDHVVEFKSWAGAPREERASWFARGFRRGLAAACNSFGEPG